MEDKLMSKENKIRSEQAIFSKVICTLMTKIGYIIAGTSMGENRIASAQTTLKKSKWIS